jgi:hypothetical protein
MRISLVVLLALAAPARATLGGDLASVESNQQHLHAARRVRKLAWGERHEMELPSRAQVQQLLSPSGIVCAVTWSGPRAPDLRELLGPYFAQLRPGRGQHHALRLRGLDLVVEAGGHRGSFSGRAWIPSLVPAGFQP